MTTERLSRGISEEFTCGVCYQLMVEPTTLQCGHSFCRHCLAMWVVQSGKQECASCRQAFNGLPKVSVTLRSTIKQLNPEEYAEREQNASVLEGQPYIEKFERARVQPALMQQAQNLFLNQGQVRRINNAWTDPKTYLGLVIISTLSIIIWSVFGWLLGDAAPETSRSRPMVQWSETEVTEWLSRLGPWAEHALTGTFQQMHIDGALLAAMQESDLAQLCNDSVDCDAFHQRALLMARDVVLQQGDTAPRDFWEYKNNHLYLVTWGLHCSTWFPRTGILLLYLFDYQNSFLPLLHSTCPVLDMQFVSLYTYQFPPPTLGQWLNFLIRWLILPQVGIFADFTLRNLWHTNLFLSLQLASLFFYMAFMDVQFAIFQYKTKCRTLRADSISWCKHLFTSVGWYLGAWTFWNLIPTFVINIFFYWSLCGYGMESLRTWGVLGNQ